MSSQKTRTQNPEVRTFHNWLNRYAYHLPFPRPWYLSPSDAEDIMGQLWLKVLEAGRLDTEVPFAYFTACVRNVIRRRGRTHRAEHEAWPLLSTHAHLRQEHENHDRLDALQRRLNLRMAERHLAERHLRALELTLEGHTSAEVSEVLRRKYGWHLTAATVRQWHVRHINPFYRAQAA